MTPVRVLACEELMRHGDAELRLKLQDETPDGRGVIPRQRRARVVLAVLVIVVYMAARYFVYATYPLRAPGDWYRRDFIMTGPRLICFLLALCLCLGCWTADELGIHRRGLRPAVLALAAFLLQQWIRAGLSQQLPPWVFWSGSPS